MRHTLATFFLVRNGTCVYKQIDITLIHALADLRARGMALMCHIFRFVYLLPSANEVEGR